jgi:hypothetical protein
MTREAYPDPAVPRTLSGWVTKEATIDRVKGPRSGEARHRGVDGWDVKGRADCVLWAKRFRRAGLARLWKERLDADYAAGLRFDLRTSSWSSLGRRPDRVS